MTQSMTLKQALNCIILQKRGWYVSFCLLLHTKSNQVGLASGGRLHHQLVKHFTSLRWSRLQVRCLTLYIHVTAAWWVKLICCAVWSCGLFYYQTDCDSNSGSENSETLASEDYKNNASDKSGAISSTEVQGAGSLTFLVTQLVFSLSL